MPSDSCSGATVIFGTSWKQICSYTLQTIISKMLPGRLRCLQHSIVWRAHSIYKHFLKYQVGILSSSEHSNVKKNNNKCIFSPEFHTAQTSIQMLQSVFLFKQSNTWFKKIFASLPCLHKQQPVMLPCVPNSHNRNGWNRYSPENIQRICLQKYSQSLQKEDEVILAAMATHLSNSFRLFLPLS